MDQKVISVLGPLPAKDLGVTDAHSHLWISPLGTGNGDAPVLDEAELILAELRKYKEAGGRSQIDCQPGDAGRDGNRLRALASQSGVNVVACTGFHLRRYYPAEAAIWRMDVNQATSYLYSEIRDGLSETRAGTAPVYPGFIKIAVRETVETSPLPLVEAAAIVSTGSGLAIEMHTERGAAAEEFLELLCRLGVSPSRLVICHMDKRPDFGLHRELAQAGCVLEYDTFFRPKYRPEANVWNLLRQMVESGWSGSLALATDLADKHLWATMGTGPGPVGFVKDVKQCLEKEIGDPAIHSKLMGETIAQRLAVHPQELTS